MSLLPGTEAPTHPDYELLVNILLEMDLESSQSPAEEMLISLQIRRENVDEASITYVAMQRAIRMLEIKSADSLIDRMEDVARLTTLFLEAFILGLRLPERQTQQ